MEERISKSSLLLMEMIISVFFFALASVVCVQLYSNAHTLSQNAEEMTHTTAVLSNLGEAWYASNGDLADALPLFAKTQTVFPEASRSLEELTEEIATASSETDSAKAAPVHLYFDRSWNLIAADMDVSTTIVSRVAYVCTLQLTTQPGSRMQSVNAAIYEFRNANVGLRQIGTQDFLYYQQIGGAE